MGLLMIKDLRKTSEKLRKIMQTFRESMQNWEMFRQL